MLNKIPEKILKVYQKLQKSGYKTYLVGGCVRSILLDIPVKDWDFTTEATPEEIQKIFPDSFYDNSFGTVGVASNHEKYKIIEVTTFRSEGKYFDKRHPEKVEWGKTIEEDLKRRDFTINAIAIEIIDDEVKIIDPFGGKDDLSKKIIKAVGNPAERFKEDALRLMRAIRIATELDFQIEENTWKEIQNDSSLIIHIAGERIRDELLRILSSNNPTQGVLILRDSGLLKQIIPELLEGIGISQARPGRHHKDDVFTHNLLSLKFCPAKDPIVLLAALLHDVGKPYCMGKDENGLVIFYNHEIVGAKIAWEICDRLRLSKKDKERVVNLIRWHMFSVDDKITDAAVRRFIRRVGVANVKDMMDLRIGDRLGGGTQTAESWRLKLFKTRVEKELSPKPFSMEDMAIDGNDVMRELNLKPGPQIGKILQTLFEEVDEDLSKNNKNYLIKRVHELEKN
ncbi:MAG: CCA tRNA nucleotidyltransferase [Candidatus Levybacteria bacterium]|nr:CCA tRNA nucleotidyltransferase [Candidatus Levybacteria bacterium]